MIICDVCGKEFANRRILQLNEPIEDDAEVKPLSSLYLDMCTNCDKNIFNLLKAFFRNKEGFSIKNYLISGDKGQ